MGRCIPVYRTGIFFLLEFHTGTYKYIFPIASVFRPALGPTQPPVQWVPGVHSQSKAQPVRNADHSPHLLPRSRMGRCYTFDPPPPSAYVACTMTDFFIYKCILIPFISFYIFVTTYPCFAFKKYTGISKFPFRALVTDTLICSATILVQMPRLKNSLNFHVVRPGVVNCCS
jgi:hypothetical protein